VFAYFATIAILGIAAAYVYLLARSVEVGLISLLAVTLFDLTFGLDANAIGRLHLRALDVVYLCLLIAGTIRFVHGIRLVNVSRGLAAGYLFVFAASLLRGMSANGLFAAANEARGFVGPLAALLYFSDAPVDERSVVRYREWYLIFGAALCGVAVLAAAGLPVGVAAWAHTYAAALDHRYLPASAVAVVAVCAFLAVGWSDGRLHGFWGRCAPVLFVLVAISLRHRTVWAMMLVGIVVIAFTDGPLFRRILPCSLLALVAVGLLVLYGPAGFDFAGEEEFATSVSNADTWEWRVNGWQELVDGSDQGLGSILFGQPMGGGWLRIDAKSHLLDAAPPHSEYVTEYLRVGLIGLGLILLFALSPLRLLWTGSQQEMAAIFPNPAIWGVITGMVLVYGVTYSIEPESYALLGLANAVASKVSAQRREPVCDLFSAGEVELSSDTAV
jgi:hypothetical protein